jgi:hypothetical protein
MASTISYNKKKNVTVVVSGSRFSIIPSLFTKVEQLEWFDVQGIPHLNADPDLFEVVLQFFLFGCLPDKAILQQRRTELLKLVSVLGQAKDLKAFIASESPLVSCNQSISTGKNHPGKLSTKSFSVSPTGENSISSNHNSSFRSVKRPFGPTSKTLKVVKRRKNKKLPKIAMSATFDSHDSGPQSSLASSLSRSSASSFREQKENKNPGKGHRWIGDKKIKLFPSSRKARHAKLCATSEFLL